MKLDRSKLTISPVMGASTAIFTGCGSVIFFIVGFGITLAQQDHRFRINVGGEDYSHQQEQAQPYYQNYRIDPYQENRYHENQYHQRQYHQEGYSEPRYEKPLVPKKKGKKEGQDFSKIPGVPGIDFPIYNSVPHTSFSCAKVPYLPGMYANPETGCQAYHTCHDGREGDQGASFLCSNGTLFSQKEFACDWWYNVNCADAIQLYRLNGDATTNPFVPKVKKDEILRDRLKIVVF